MNGINNSIELIIYKILYIKYWDIIINIKQF